VGNIVFAMPMKDLVDLCFYFNFNIIGKSKEDVLTLLLHPTSGSLWSNVMFGNKSINPCDVILNRSYGEDFLIKSTINKAVILGIIKLSAGGSYTYGDSGVILGVDIESVYAYFKTNIDTFRSSLYPSVQASDILPESIDYTKDLDNIQLVMSEKKEEMRNTDVLLMDTWDLSDKERAIQEAIDLGVIGNVKGFKEETLREKILEKRTKSK
jgi:hypothetical protein